MVAKVPLQGANKRAKAESQLLNKGLSQIGLPSPSRDQSPSRLILQYFQHPLKQKRRNHPNRSLPNKSHPRRSHQSKNLQRQSHRNRNRLNRKRTLLAKMEVLYLILVENQDIVKVQTLVLFQGQSSMKIQLISAQLTNSCKRRLRLRLNFTKMNLKWKWINKKLMTSSNRNRNSLPWKEKPSKKIFQSTQLFLNRNLSPLLPKNNLTLTQWLRLKTCLNKHLI